MNATTPRSGGCIHFVVLIGCIESAHIGGGCILSAIGRDGEKIVWLIEQSHPTPPWGRPVAFKPPCTIWRHTRLLFAAVNSRRSNDNFAILLMSCLHGWMSLCPPLTQESLHPGAFNRPQTMPAQWVGGFLPRQRTQTEHRGETSSRLLRRWRSAGVARVRPIRTSTADGPSPEPKVFAEVDWLRTAYCRSGLPCAIPDCRDRTPAPKRSHWQCPKDSLA